MLTIVNFLCKNLTITNCVTVFPNMKLSKICIGVIVKFVLVASAQASNVVSVSLDKNYYFVDKSNSQLEIKVSNDSAQLAGVSIEIFESQIIDGKPVFDYKEQSVKTDIFPNNFILPREKNQIVTILNKKKNSVYKEDFHAVQAVPMSIKEMSKFNPQITSLLSNNDRLEAEELLFSSDVNVNIGYGSIIITQPFKKVNTNNIEFVISGKNLTITNNGTYTTQISSIELDGKKTLKNTVILGGNEKQIKLPESTVRINKLSFVDQFEKKHVLTCINNICK